MLKRVVSGITLALLLISMLILTFNIQPVKAATIVVPDDYPTIQEAINAANPGDTVFVRNGTYQENITIDRPLSLVAESRDAIITQDYTYYTVEVRADNVTVRGFTIQNNPHPYDPPLPCGVLLNSSSNCQIIDNELGPTPMPAGIIVDCGSENRIVGNEIAECSGYGIMVEGSISNVIMQNTMDVHANALVLVCSNHNYVFCNYFAVHFSPHSCVWLLLSSSNIIEGNTLYDHSYDGIGRMELLSSCNNSIFHNNFDGYAGAEVSLDEDSKHNVWDDGYPSGGNYWIDYAGADLDKDGIGDTPHVIDGSNQDNYPLMNPWSPTIQNLNTGLYYATIQGAINSPETLTGHTVFVSSGTYYENVVVNKSVSLIGEDRETTIIDGNGTGNVVLVEGDDSVTVTEVTVRNGNNGFYILGFNHSIIGNVVTNNTYHGIELVGINNSVTENTVTDNLYGILLGGSSCNIISRNTILSNQGGINLDENCERNEISENTLMDNVMGIGIVGSNNSVFGNTIKENWSGLEISGTNNTIYHNSFVNNTIQVYSGMLNNAWDNGCEGNYWSNYNGTDLDGDGVGDTELPWEGVDYYPLMDPYWNPADVDHDLDVDLYDAARLLKAYGSELGDEEYNCHCDIAEPYGQIDLYDAVLLLVNYGKKYS